MFNQKKTIFGATCHVGFTALPKVWKDAKFIHLVRDPRDVAVSNVKLGWVSHYYFSSDNWKKAECDWDALLLKLGKDQYLEFCYEKLISDPELELRRVCEFLGVEYTEKLFDYVKTTEYSYPKKEFVDRWKEQLTAMEIQLTEARIYQLMQTRNYTPASDEKSYSAIATLSFRVINDWSRRVNRIRKNGLTHVFLSKLARSLDWKFLKERIEKKQSERRKKHISELERNY